MGKFDSLRKRNEMVKAWSSDYQKDYTPLLQIQNEILIEIAESLEKLASCTSGGQLLTSEV